MTALVTVICIIGTLFVYDVMRRLYAYYKHPLLNVVGLSAAIIIAVLLLCDMPYAAYEPAKEIMTSLMGAATVSLALPLYRFRKLLIRDAASILLSVSSGALVAMFSAGYIVQCGGLPREVVISILTKGVSIPFAVEVTAINGGDPSLAAAFVVATGTLGSLLGAWTLDQICIKAPFSRGLTLGTVAHGQGVAAALQENEEAGAMAGLAMILAGIFTAGVAPGVILLLRLLA